MTSSWKPLILTLAITGALAVACTDGDRSPGEGQNNLSAAGQAGRAGTGGADAGRGSFVTAGAGNGGGAAGGGAGGQSNVTCRDLSPEACHTSGLNCCSLHGQMWVVHDAEQCIQSYTKDYRACAMYMGSAMCGGELTPSCFRRKNGATTEWVLNMDSFYGGSLDPMWEFVNLGSCKAALPLDKMPLCAPDSGG